MVPKSNLRNESYDQNRRDMSINSKKVFSQNYTVQSIRIKVQLIVTEIFSKKLHFAIRLQSIVTEEVSKNCTSAIV